MTRIRMLMIRETRCKDLVPASHAYLSLYRFPQWEAQIEKRPAMKGSLFLPYIGETDDTNLSHEYLFLSMYTFVPFLGA